ncbi:MAG: outer membrane protein assembly factor BamB family protein, partial [Candidatus Latescibacterota bacterium]
MYCFDAESGERKWTYETGYYINGAPATDGQIIVFGGCDQMLHIVSAADGVKRGEVNAGSYIAGSAALVGGRAYVGNYDGKLVCIDIPGKKIMWEYEDGENRSEFFSSPAVGNNRVYIGSRDHFLHCVDRETGRQVWKFRTRGDVDSSPVIVGDTIVFGSADGRLYVIDSENGKEVWSYEIGAPLLGSPAVVDGMVVIGATDGRVYAFGESK